MARARGSGGDSDVRRVEKSPSEKTDVENVMSRTFGPELEDSIGLQAERVSVVDHDPRWSKVFDEAEIRLRSVLPLDAAEIEHVGSTAVPGLAAKPIIDIAVGLRTDVDPEAIAFSVEALGFDYVGDFGVFGGRLFVYGKQPDVVGVHVHLIEHGDEQWERYVAFRDGLRSDPELAASYERLKRRLALEHAHDRASYTQAKFDFVLQNAERLAARRR